MNLLSKVLQNKNPHPTVVSFAAGLYPLLHYYNGNFDIADTLVQFLLLLGLCLGIPIVCTYAFPLLFRIKKIPFLEKRYISAINLVVFAGLLGLLIFHFTKKEIALVLLVAGILGLWLYQHLNKIIILQYLLALMSVVSLVPRVIFVLQYDNDWTEVNADLPSLQFENSPNIYVIQPDGYANSKALKEPPYNYNNSKFENWLENRSFTIYENFRSNYYSTLTSNASMFAMKHHYYRNTYPGNLKTIGSQEVVVGSNITLDILKNNGYTTHFVTDNSFFLTNRKLKGFDACNIPQEKVLFYDTGGIYGIDIVSDFTKYLDGQTGPNFYFIEKTIPSHIQYSKENSLGIEMERVTYLERLEVANSWLEELVLAIEEYDKDPLIVIVADHGGYVGLNYLKEVETKKLNKLETESVFDSFLSIRWPGGEVPDNLEFVSNVNLFRNVFSHLANRPDILEFKEENTSYLPLYTGFNATFFECLDHEGKFGYKPIQ